MRKRPCWLREAVPILPKAKDVCLRAKAGTESPHLRRGYLTPVGPYRPATTSGGLCTEDSQSVRAKRALGG
jgi:hypothetical protein